MLPSTGHRRKKDRQRRQYARRAQLRMESLESRQLMAYDVTVLADNPVAYYRFEDAAGSVATNAGSAGTAADGMVIGGIGVVAGANATLGNAYSFNGSNGRVQLPDVAAFDLGTGPATFELWFSTTQASRGDLFTYKVQGGTDFGIHWNSNGTNRASVYHNGFRTETANNFVGGGQWHHLVYTRSNTGVNGTVLYLDGRAVAKGQDDVTFNIANAILIGANHSGNPSTGAATFFNGQIDEVAIYGSSLTEAQVQRHYEAGLGNYAGAVFENKPAVYYNFNAAAGATIAEDSTANDRDGSLIGGVTYGVGSPLNQPIISSSRSPGAYAVSGNDLLTGLVPAATGTIDTVEGTSGNTAILTDGNFGTPDSISGPQTLAVRDNTTLTYQLDTTTNPLGYRINSIHTFTGWQDNGRVNQDYRVEYATVSNPGVFAPLATVGVGNGDNSLQVNITAASGVLATSVGQIRFIFPGQQNNYVGYRELDVIGAPVAPGEAINLGTAADFNGSDGYIVGPTASALGMTNGSWTATAWIRPESNSGDRAIFGNVGPNTDNTTLHLITRGGVLHFGIYGGNDLPTTTSPPLNQWSHVAFTYDAVNNRATVYFNGAPIATRTTGADYSGTETIRIGSWGGGNYWDGQIDEAAIFSQALSPAEIAGMYRTTMAPRANNDSYTTGETSNISGDLIANDTGVRQVSTPGALTTGAGASVVVNPNGTFSYNVTPAMNALGQTQSITDSFLYSLAGVGINLPTANLRFGSFGPGGTVNAYLHLPVNLSWDDARAYAAGLSFGGVSGHLVTINSAAENAFLRANYTGTFWMGLSDSTGYALDGVKNSQADSGNSATSQAWAWSNAEPYTYQNWAVPGEPNGGTGENVGEFRGDALWNDLSTQTINAVIEFNLGEEGTAAAGFAFRQLRQSGTLSTDNTSAENLLATSVGSIAEFRYGVYPVLNFVGSGNAGRYGGDVAYPIAGDQSNFAVEATSTIFIPAAGSYTFGVASDDGFKLTITGATLTNQIVNGAASSQGLNGTLSFSGGRGSDPNGGGETLGVFTFPSAGFYPVRVISYEGGGGDSVELYAAPGALNAFNASVFDLVGDVANGGLVALTNTPSLTTESALVTVTVVGENDVPVAGTVAAQTIDEGQSVTFTMVGASDADSNAVLEYDWDINGDGTYDVTTNVPTVTQTPAQLEALGMDGPFSSNTIRARVRDEVGASAVVTTSLTVNNLNPVAGISGPTAAGRTRSNAFTFTGTDVAADQAAGLTFVVNWGDTNSQTFNNVTSGSVNASHTYTANGTYTVTLTVTDRNGASDVETSTITIGGPTLSFESAPATGNEDALIDLGIIVANTDPEPGTFSVVISGIPANAQITDAAGVAFVTGNPSSVTLTAAQANEARIRKDDNQPEGSPNATFNLTVTATSTPTNNAVSPISVSATRSVTVNNAAPVATISGPSSVGRGQLNSYTFTATDSVGDEAAGFTYVINWGDGSPVQTFSNLGPDGVTLTHTFASESTPTITLTVTDHDNQSGTDTLPVTVSAVFVDAEGNLVIGGTNSADRIVLYNAPGGIVAMINNKRYPALQPEDPGRVLVYGGGGNDTITVQNNVAYPAEIFGGAGNDYITGSAQADILHGEDGSDRLLGGGGNDTILGGNGNDTISGGAGNDFIQGDVFLDANGDTVEGTGADKLSGDVGNDTIEGGAGNDTINGGVGNDFLYGGLGGDQLRGDAGNDLLMGQVGGDFLYGFDGSDVLIGGDGGDTLYGGNGDDMLLGDGLSDADALLVYNDWNTIGSAGIGSAPLSDYPSLVEQDNDPDNLYGQIGTDWLLLFLSSTNINDRARDGKPGEIEQH